jgi:hypothetical protein
LERHGLAVRFAQLLDRPTPLEGQDGLRNWFQMFCSMIFRGLPKDIQPRFFELVEERTKENLWKEDHWVADYVRLRIMAEKPVL